MSAPAVTKPVLIEVIKPADCSGSPTCSSDENIITKPERKGFWQYLFGERKCKSCLLYKSECLCRENKTKCKKAETIDYTKCEHEHKAFICKCTTQHGIQSRGKCLPKCDFPHIHRECGRDFYFCIDQKQNTPQIVNTSAICHSSEKINKIQMQKYVADCWDSSSSCGEQTKMIMFCKNSSQNVKTESAIAKSCYAYTYMVNTEPLVYKLPNTSSLSDLNHCKEGPIEKTTTSSYSDKTISYQTVKYSNREMETGNVHVENKKSTYSLTEEKEIARHNPLEKSMIVAENQTKSDLNQTVTEEKPIIAIEHKKTINKFINSKDILSTNKLTNTVDNNKTKCTEDDNQSPIQEKLDKSLKPKLMSSSNMTDIMKSETKYANEERNKKNISLKENITKDSDEEYNLLNYNRKKSKIRTSARSGFTRNSLITLRQRKQSQMEDTMNIILEKLEKIKDKIEKLENSSNKKDSGVVKKMSCNKNESNILIHITNSGKNNQTQDIPVCEALKTCIKTLNIRSQDENVCINTSKEFTVINVKDNILKPRALDAHTIVSRNNQPRTVVCKNPKILIENLPNNKSRKKIFCDKWRRISEELKLSQTDFSSCYE